MAIVLHDHQQPAILALNLQLQLRGEPECLATLFSVSLMAISKLRRRGKSRAAKSDISVSTSNRHWMGVDFRKFSA